MPDENSNKTEQIGCVLKLMFKFVLCIYSSNIICECLFF